MAINTGINATKIVRYLVGGMPQGIDTSKVTRYLVGGPPNTNPPVWGAMGLSDGYVAIPYSQSFDLYPAATPTTFALAPGSGPLPSGLTLSNVIGDTGKIDGIPTLVGVFPIIIRATNDYGYADRSVSITISEVPTGGSTGVGYWIT